MSKEKKTLWPLFKIFLVVLISSIFSYYFIQVLIHELGHYTFAYAFNKTAIANFSFPVLEALTTLNPSASFYPAVNYKDPMIKSFSITQIFLISFAGYFFELIYFVFLVLVLEKLLKKKFKLYMAIPFGFYLSTFSMFVGWFNVANINADVYKIILTFPNIYLGLAFVLIVEALTIFFYFKYLIKFSKNLL
ncbi:MAG: hypothetical protein QXD43_00965 [Candidatus Aenigmatarchaeota archaeon]